MTNFEVFRIAIDRQEASEIGYCDKCGGEIYQEESAAFDDIKGAWICSDCQIKKEIKEEIGE